VSAAGVAGQALSLREAVDLALTADEPRLAAYTARAEALKAKAVADGQLPDPTVSSGLANVPIAEPELDGADMTLVTLGLRQDFPPGDSRTLLTRQGEVRAQAEDSLLEAERRTLLLETRQAWLELAYRQQSLTVLESAADALDALLDSLSAGFASGRLHVQDTLRTGLERDLLSDSMQAHEQAAQEARARLARYIGERSAAAPAAIPDLPLEGSAATRLEALLRHPRVEAMDARIEAASTGVALAEAQYRPAFSVQAGYGLRTERRDFASIGLGVSLPLFTEQRQDQRRVAALRGESAERLERQALLLDLRRELEAHQARWAYLSRRLKRYDTTLMQQARAAAEAAETTYASGQTDFAELIRARLALLDVELQRLTLVRDRALAWAGIRELTGESQ
jgi:outer membrane protein TolC